MASLTFDSRFYTTSRNTNTHYLQTGHRAGPLIICLHGLGGSVDTFKSLVPLLPHRYNIVLVDFQGFGKTPLTSKTEALSIDGHVSDLHDIVSFLQADSNGVADGRKVRGSERNDVHTVHTKRCGETNQGVTGHLHRTLPRDHRRPPLHRKERF